MRDYGVHVPVLGIEAVRALNVQDSSVHVDATMGGGGYTRMMLGEADAQVFAFDRDPTAIERARVWAAAYGGRLHLVPQSFDQMAAALPELGTDEIDGVVFDLGVSSWQLDEADRGFSFAKEGPLNMRMDGGSLETGKPNAADLIAHAEAKDLADIFYIYGEEKKSRQIARVIVEAREKKSIRTTLELAEVVRSAVGSRAHEKIHPATRVFQAIRIFVNDELGQLVRALAAAEGLLCPSGRLAVVSFHSLEDRIVKKFFAARSNAGGGGSRHMPEVSDGPEPTFSLLHRKPTLPSDEEVAANPRARSAKLRVGVRTTAPALEITDKFAASIGLPSLTLSAALKNWVI